MTTRTQKDLAALDHAHLWHPFTPMQQWRETPPLIIERGEGPFLFDVDGRRYIDGVSSLWCNVHGHRTPAIDQAIRDQLEKVAHTTLLGLSSPPAIELAARLVELAPRGEGSEGQRLNKVFYSDAGATALEVAFKMAVGYWHHTGKLGKTRFVGLRGAYHGDTTGSMSVGFDQLFHEPFLSMVFPTYFTSNPDAPRPPRELRSLLEAALGAGRWPSEDSALSQALLAYCLRELRTLLERHAHELAAIVIEPAMQGAAGMVCQPPGFVRGVAQLAREFDVLLIADEVATGFGRTGRMFACEHDAVTPDILCVAKGITGGYLPLAATLTTDRVEQAFCGSYAQRRTLFHGHTYTGNALACAAALASIDLFESSRLLEHVQQSAAIVRGRLEELRACPHVLDVRQRGLMVGVELCQQRSNASPLNYTLRTGTAVCQAMRSKGLIVRPLGDVVVLMPILAMDHATLHEMLTIVIDTICCWRFE